MMVYRSRHAKGLALLMLLGLLCPLFYTPTIQAQQPASSSPRDSLIQAIEGRAAKDVEIKRPPASVSDLEALFGSQAQAVTMPLNEVLTIYEEAYQRAVPKKTWWQKLEPNMGWITAAVLMVLLILRDFLKKVVTGFFEKLAEAIYQQVAGLRPFWWISLRRYQRSLARNYRELKIPFRPGRPLRMREIYVPLKISGSSDRSQVDIHSALSAGDRLMIVGPPGSGKSMLIKHLTLTYAVQGLGSRRKRAVFNSIPILLELHRLNDPSKSLEEHLAAALDRQHFPSGKSFLKAGLERGLLLLLLDGLDEVNQDARERVVREIKDLAKRGAGCQFVVTCRSAVYNDELADWSDKLMEIVEFDDRQIESFLAAWEPEMPEEKSVEHLLHSLRERPRIMALARNPLLLTIIAYLYSDTPFVLPHSRADFYKQATTVLLDQWDQARQLRNRFKAAHKRLVLQALALAFQARGQSTLHDRRSMSLAEALKEITEVLKTLNLDAKDAEPLLEEIVERSGLVLALDGKTRYQFTHLTLQEFFAALALANEEQTLIDNFEADPGAWREVAKLWCGLEHDSTNLLKSLAAVDPIAAVECLGDTQQVEEDFARELIDEFMDSIDQADETRAKALALAAADPRPRGEETFTRLAAISRDPAASEATQLAAARILSLTSLPKAVDHLAQLASTDARFRPLLANLGNLSIPYLSDLASEGAVWAADLLLQIGTPKAAISLAPLLWREEPIRCTAAFHLGSLLADPTVEAALADLNLTSEQRAGETLEWVWAPFMEDPKAVISMVVGRIAHILVEDPPRELPELVRDTRLDPRLALALCCVTRGLDPGKIGKLDRQRLLAQFRTVFSSSLPISVAPEEKVDFVATSKARLKGPDPLWLFLFFSLPVDCQFDLLKRRLQNRDFSPAEADWQNINRPLAYEFSTSFYGRASRALLAALMIWTLYTCFVQFDTAYWLSLRNGTVLLSALLALMLIGPLIEKHWDPEEVLSSTTALLAIGACPVLGALSVGGFFLESLGALLLLVIFFGIYDYKFSKFRIMANRDLIWVFIIGGLAFLIARGIGDSLGAWCGGCISVISVAYLLHLHGESVKEDVFEILAIGVIAGTICAALFLVVFQSLGDWGWLPTSLIWWAGTFALIAFSSRGRYLERLANNPLHGLLDPILERSQD